MFYFFGVGLNIFLLVLLLSKKNKSFADKILAGWLFVIGCHLALYVLGQQPITLTTIHQMGLSVPIPFLHGPFLYLYTATLTNLLPANRRMLWLHFMPAVLVALAISPLIMTSAAYKMEVFQNKGRDYEGFLSVVAWLMRLSGIVYATWSFYLLGKHKKNIGRFFSYEERINLNWLRYFIYALVAVWVIIIFVRKDSFIFTAVVLFVVFLGFFGIKQVGIFGNKPEINPAIPENEEKTISIIDETPQTLHEQTVLETAADNGKAEPVVRKKKYANSGITDELVIDIHNRLKELMNKEKIYCESELSLSTLAAKLNVHPNYLSQVINEKEGKSFFDYINALRVEEFKRLIALPQSSRFTLMSLAFDCGFNSKSSFNKNFKKVTGLSPSEYSTKINNE